MAEKPERNKRNAIAFYDLMFNQGNPSESINKYVGDTYIPHNHDVGDCKEEAFIEYFERMTNGYPGKRAHINQAGDSRRELCSFALLPGMARDSSDWAKSTYSD